MVKYTKEQLLYFLKKSGKTSTIKKWNKKKYPSASTYAKRFGSWNKALIKAGLKPNSKKYTKTELVDMIKQLGKQLSRRPKTSDLKPWCASYSTFRKYFGSWKKALSKAGYKKSGESNLKYYLK